MDDTIIYLILPFAGGLILYFLTRGIIRWGGYSLQSKFCSLGQVAGKTRAEVESVVGPPHSASSLADGRVVLQWMATGYHIVLRFNGCGEQAVCEGITHEVSV